MSSQYSTWGSFWQLHHGEMCARARRLIYGDADSAEDIVQETMLRILHSGRQPAELEKPLAYAYRAMRSVVIDRARHNGPVRPDSLDDSESEVHNKLPIRKPTVQHDLEYKELLKAIRGRLTGLSSEEKELFDLLFVEGRAPVEIAHIRNEDIRITRTVINALKAKLRYRFKNGL